jgi:hypothetical protein
MDSLLRKDLIGPFFLHGLLMICEYFHILSENVIFLYFIHLNYYFLFA